MVACTITPSGLTRNRRLRERNRKRAAEAARGRRGYGLASTFVGGFTFHYRRWRAAATAKERLNDIRSFLARDGYMVLAFLLDDVDFEYPLAHLSHLLYVPCLFFFF
jgi:hypothetical protein